MAISAAAPESISSGESGSAHLRLAHSVLSPGAQFADEASFHRWWKEVGDRDRTRVRRVAFDELERWRRDPATGDLGHESGKFFTVHGLDVRLPGAPVEHWQQPIISQPEVGILGLLVKEFDGVLHCLMQAKIEPGNAAGMQLSPTVQATRSNYTRVHGGNPVPYLDYFRDAPPHQVIADVRQSEQGAWFARKRNRNMVVEASGDVELGDRFCWLTLGQVYRLLAVEDLINMDARTVLSCLPLAGQGLSGALPARHRFAAALAASCTPDSGALHPTAEVLSWITEQRTRHEVHTARAPLDSLAGWRYDAERVAHESGLFFSVIGVNVLSEGREVRQWCQPMIEPSHQGLNAFLVRDFGGVLHALVHARVEPGYLDVAELAPTVQCTVENYTLLPDSARPPFLDDVLDAAPERIRYDTVLSEEGGRFHQARNRYVVVETERDADHPDYRWVALHQLTGLLRHSHYVNVQARTLTACLHSLTAADGSAFGAVGAF
ncbi:NDP-hexose 2,3-dehydratase family protein [Streptomyces boncukensis]|uniref:NDP-hexose 2,3-dehydratase n=1 Tax=Streptomyces boncukensis TaxID=2711219 RepID=A0A6G4X473_9ACTN|nr:NDP-hexose 2,3-dehydratase family protein [Streptomyces boncukensis]NGO72339.1 NDP-hexose 2,3-dehydratase [Streptomyces boncukensis]